MRYLWQALVSIPTLFTWIFFLLRVSGNNPEWGPVTLGLNFLALCACIAMAILKPEVREWRVAAMFNAVPFILILLLVGILPLS